MRRRARMWRPLALLESARRLGGRSSWYRPRVHALQHDIHDLVSEVLVERTHLEYESEDDGAGEYVQEGVCAGQVGDLTSGQGPDEQLAIVRTKRGDQVCARSNSASSESAWASAMKPPSVGPRPLAP